jgi:hypothetical protein
MAYQSFEDLEVWQRGCRFTVEVFNTFGPCKEFTLKDQIQRSALSIASNISEGSERGSLKDFAHFLNIARKLGLIAKPPFDALIAESRELSAMLEGLRRSLLSRATSKRKRPS